MTDDEHAGFGFTHDAAAAMKAELERELADRRRFYPGMVEKGRLDPQESERRIALFADLIEDLGRAFPAAGGLGRELPLSTRRFSWRDKLAELRRELAVRQRFYPDRIAKGRLTEDESRRRIAALQLVPDLYWIRCLCWEPDGELARQAHDERILRFEARDFDRPLDHPGDRAMRDEMTAHLLALVAEDRQEQEELGV